MGLQASTEHQATDTQRPSYASVPKAQATDPALAKGQVLHPLLKASDYSFQDKSRARSNPRIEHPQSLWQRAFSFPQLQPQFQKPDAVGTRKPNVVAHRYRKANALGVKWVSGRWNEEGVPTPRDGRSTPENAPEAYRAE